MGPVLDIKHAEMRTVVELLLVMHMKPIKTPS
jgi:hypothetical protein